MTRAEIRIETAKRRAKAAEAAAKAEGLALTFEGFLADGAVWIFTARDGEWVMVILRADGSACPVAAGKTHDITLGSLM